jgi:hypothetical protein
MNNHVAREIAFSPLNPEVMPVMPDVELNTYEPGHLTSRHVTRIVDDEMCQEFLNATYAIARPSSPEWPDAVRFNANIRALRQPVGLGTVTRSTRQCGRILRAVFDQQ